MRPLNHRQKWSLFEHRNDWHKRQAIGSVEHWLWQYRAEFLLVQNGKLYSDGTVYEQQEMPIDVDLTGQISAVIFENGRYEPVGYTDPCLESSQIDVTVTHDNYPEETSWSLFKTSNGNDSVLLSQAQDTVHTDGTVVSEKVTVGAGQYKFVMNDSYGDGNCCAYGNGSFEVSVNGQTIYTGGDFGTSTGDLVFCIESNGTTKQGAC